jgi:5-methyltetrahydropteroyltriglutamate--homocysteine methyltransferase
MTNVFRADQIGSFLRPPHLLAARADHEAGRIDAAQLQAIEDQAILDVLEMQRRVGIDVDSDGEFRRSWFSSAFADSIEGIVTDFCWNTTPSALVVSNRCASSPTIKW